MAVQEIFQYLECTIDNGIYFWQPQKNLDLPAPSDNHGLEQQDCEAKLQDSSGTLQAAPDSDWGGDISHQRSITGLEIKLAGGSIIKHDTNRQ